MADSDVVHCSPSKRLCTESSSADSSVSSAECHASVSASTTSSLTAMSIIELSQPLSFFLTKVDGIESKFNQPQSLDIKGTVSSYNSCIDVVITVAYFSADCYSAPVGEWSIAISLSVCLSVREHISGTAGPIFRKFLMQIPCGCGWVFIWWHCDMLCTYGFMNDVTFGRNEPYGNAWKAEPLTYYH